MPWESSGWNNDRNVRMLVGLLVSKGEVAAAGREGRERLYDLAERVYPDVPPVPLDEALAIRRERRLRALGIARARSARRRASPTTSATPASRRSSRVSAARGASTRRTSRVSTPFDGRAALLSPLDRLVMDRKRQEEILGFDYQLEMYKPAAKRRWGYWAMPILYGDALVGKLDATSDRDAGVLRVDAVHEDGAWTRKMRDAVDEQIAALAAWLGLVEERATLQRNHRRQVTGPAATLTRWT